MSFHYILADIGGTHSTFSLVEIVNDDLKEFHRHIFQTQEYNSFNHLIDEFIDQIKDHQITELKAVIAAAGPVEKQRIELTNANLVIDKREIEKNTIIDEVILMNDLSAVSYSTFFMEKENLIQINKGEPYGDKSLVIGCGTGLGVSLIFNKEVIESEGGHIDFPMEEDFEKSLIDFIRKKKNQNQIEFEHIVSGKGIELIYEFLSNVILSAEEISKQKISNEHAKKTFDLFYKFYARFLKEMTLEFMPQKAIYLAGGIIEKNLDFSHEEFLKEFTSSENHREFLSRIPIYIIKNYDTSILGLENYIRLKENL